MSKFHAVLGDVTQQNVDAIVTLINPDGMWFGGVDGAIMRVAGDQFHSVPARKLSEGLKDQQVIIASGRNTQHNGMFRDVIFVVDALREPLSKLVSIALKAAADKTYNKIAFPLMRTGVMLGVIEKDIKEVVDEMTKAFKDFNAQDSQMEICVVIFGDTEAFRLMEKALKTI